jgi:hypothetical protein
MSLSMPFRAFFALSVSLSATNPSASQEMTACPPHSVGVSKIEGNVRTITCHCVKGYTEMGNSCVAHKPKLIMRPMTRAECVRVAGKDLRDALAACRSPLVDCLVAAGVRINEATCAASSLVSMLAVAADPSKASSVVLPAVAGDVVACGREAYDAVEKCSPTWGACQDGPLKAYKDAVATCPPFGSSHQ